jgi:hypothetical protein
MKAAIYVIVALLLGLVIFTEVAFRVRRTRRRCYGQRRPQTRSRS